MARKIDTDYKSEASKLAQLYELQYKDIAINLFKWSNLPMEVDSRIIEKLLYENGKIAFAFDDMIGFITLPVAPYDQLNVYGLPTRYRVIGYNYNKEYNVDNAVIIKNTYLEEITSLMVKYYISKLVDLDQAIQVNINSTKMPVIYEGKETELLSMKNEYEKIIGNTPVLFKNKNTNPEIDYTFKAHTTGAVYLGSDYYDMKKNFVNELLTYLGIDNSNIDKKERAIVDEVNANNEIISQNLKRMLDSRKDAADKINEMFGLNIQVEINYEMINQVTESNDPDEEEVENG